MTSTSKCVKVVLNGACDECKRGLPEQCTACDKMASDTIVECYWTCANDTIKTYMLNETLLDNEVHNQPDLEVSASSQLTCLIQMFACYAAYE